MKTASLLLLSAACLLLLISGLTIKFMKQAQLKGLYVKLAEEMEKLNLIQEPADLDAGTDMGVPTENQEINDLSEQSNPIQSELEEYLDKLKEEAQLKTHYVNLAEEMEKLNLIQEPADHDASTDKGVPTENQEINDLSEQSNHLQSEFEEHVDKHKKEIERVKEMVFENMRNLSLNRKKRNIISATPLNRQP